MTITSLLRIATLAVAIAAPAASFAPAFAASNDQEAALSAAPTQSSGPYDGADWEAAKHAFY